MQKAGDGFTEGLETRPKKGKFRETRPSRSNNAVWPSGKRGDRKSTRLNSSHQIISYAVFCLKKKKKDTRSTMTTQYLTAMTRIMTSDSNTEVRRDGKAYLLENRLCKASIWDGSMRESQTKIA